MQGAPDDECPCGAVPEAAYKKDYHDVNCPFNEGDAVAAEGDIDIILEPRCEGDMPAAPEISDGAGGIWAIEVLS